MADPAALRIAYEVGLITNIEADPTEDPIEQKVLRNKPVEAFDFCYIGTDYQTKVTDQKVCNADPILRYYASPRQVAGGPLSEDILKCQLKPLKRGDYDSGFSDAQWSRLKKTFASGVCDWSKPGVGMQASIPLAILRRRPRRATAPSGSCVSPILGA